MVFSNMFFDICNNITIYKQQSYMDFIKKYGIIELRQILISVEI